MTLFKLLLLAMVAITVVADTVNVVSAQSEEKHRRLGRPCGGGCPTGKQCVDFDRLDCWIADFQCGYCATVYKCRVNKDCPSGMKCAPGVRGAMGICF